MYKQKAKMKQRKISKGSRGITLIALVITIIVLLILAAVSIATLTGDNGILTKAGDARTQTEKAGIKEEVNVAILGSRNNRAEVDYDKLLDNLGQIEGVSGVPSKDDEPKYPIKFQVKRGTTTYNVEIKEDENGNLSIEVNSGTTTGGSDPTPPEEEKLATEVLKINTEASEDAQDYEKSPYVTYNNILCRVFYNDDYNDGNHGLQIISADNITTKDSEGNDIEEKITLGYGDTNEKVSTSDFDYEGSATIDDNFKKAASSYNRAVDTLNEKAKSYKDDSGIAIDARSLGSIATLKDGKFQLDDTSTMYHQSGFITTYKWDGKFKNTDTNYKEDAENETTGRLQKLGLNATSATWIASRCVIADSYSAYFLVRVLTSSGYTWDNRATLFSLSTWGDANDFNPSNGFRPIFLLSSDVKIAGGDGTRDNPYELEI